jgi:hypothetical protein
MTPVAMAAFTSEGPKRSVSESPVTQSLAGFSEVGGNTPGRVVGGGWVVSGGCGAAVVGGIVVAGIVLAWVVAGGSVTGGVVGGTELAVESRPRA